MPILGLTLPKLTLDKVDMSANIGCFGVFTVNHIFKAFVSVEEYFEKLAVCKASVIRPDKPRLEVYIDNFERFTAENIGYAMLFVRAENENIARAKGIIFIADGINSAATLDIRNFKLRMVMLEEAALAAGDGRMVYGHKRRSAVVVGIYIKSVLFLRKSGVLHVFTSKNKYTGQIPEYKG